MNKRIIDYGSIAFCLLWTFLILLDYWYYHPSLYSSLVHFQYIGLIGVLSVIGVGIGFLLVKFKKLNSFLLNGLGALVLFLIVSAIVIVMHFNSLGTDLELSPHEVVNYIGKLLYIVALTYLVFGVCYVLGAAVIDYLLTISFAKGLEDIIIKIGLGIAILSIILFILGAFDLLQPTIVWGILLVSIAIVWKKTLFFLKATLIQTPSSKTSLNWIGFTCFYITLIFVSLIYLQNIRPFPFGFDALALYMNIPKLIWAEQGLVEGFTPYYWSLFVTLGYILTNQIELVFSLSTTGGLLTAIAMYAIARRWLSINNSFITSLLFFSLPLVNFQSFKDVKTDLGLLCILMSIVLVLINYIDYLHPKEIANKSKKNKIEKSLPKNKLAIFEKREVQYALLLGVLSGLALGIKLTALILIFSVVAIFFYFKVGLVGLITSMIFTFLVVLVGGLDVASGLRPYHFGTNWLRWVVLGLSLIGFGYLAYEHKRRMLNLIMICAVYAFFSGLTYLPWPIKHYQERQVLEFQTIIEGKGQRPVPPSFR